MASRRQCKRALELHSPGISRLANVVGLGIVPDLNDPKSHALAVYVSKKLPRKKLDPDHMVPPTVEIPGRGKIRHRINVHVIEQGPVELEADEFGFEAG